MSSTLLVFDRKLREAREHWMAELAGWQEIPRLRDASGPRAGPGELRFELPDDACEAIRRLTGGGSFLLFTTLLAGLGACLVRYLGSREVLVGGAARRGSSGAAPAPQALAHRLRLPRGQTVKQYLVALREHLLAAYRHQEYPFPRLLRDLEGGSGESDGGLFDVALVLEGFHGELLDAGQGLSLFAREHGGRVELDARFDPSRFSPPFVEQVLRHWARWLASAPQALDEPCERVELLSAGEREQLLRGAMAGLSAGAHGPLVPQLVLFQVGARPDSIAVIDGERNLSYEALEREAGALSAAVFDTEAGAEERVALFFDPGLEEQVATWAVLRSGRAFVPVDPDQPAARVELALREAEVAVVLTSRSLAGRLPAGDWRVERVDEERSTTGRSTPAVIHDAGLAYVIFTSGSTGQPKGVGVTHRGLANLVLWHRETYALAPGDCGSQLANPAFDAAVWEVWPYLASGAAVAVVPEEARKSVPELRAWLECGTVTHAFVPTAMSAALIADPPASRRLRALLTGGDRLRARPRKALSYSFVNHYGPTECTVVATSWEVEPGEAAAEQPPIGLPVAGMTAYVLDEWLEPVPAWAPGQLHLSGPGLARGYLRSPALTAERFLPDPHGPCPGGRLYATGDRVRRRPDGVLEFLGREDHQVKVGGYRIERGEIEAVLSSIPGVEQVAVEAPVDRGGDPRLVAFVVLSAGSRLLPSSLEQETRQRLPSYMVPRSYVLLSELPVTSRGKLDRRALASRLPPRLADEGSYLAPRTAVEAVLAEIWSQVLDLDRIGVEARFFDLGGDSIKAIQVVARAAEAGLLLSAQDLFEHPTVAELARAVEEGAAFAASGELLSTVATPAQHRWLASWPAAVPPSWLVLEPSAALQGAALQRGLEEVVHELPALRQTFQPGPAGRWRMGFAPSAAVLWREADLRALTEPGAAPARRDELVAELANNLDPLRGVMVAALLAIEPGGLSRCYLQIHPLAADLWSWPRVVDAWERRLQRPGILPQPTSSRPAGEPACARFGRRLLGRASSPAVLAERERWALLHEGAEGPGQPSTTGEVRWGRCRALSETAAGLEAAQEHLRSSAAELLAACLLEALTTTSEKQLWIDLELDGRQGVCAGLDLADEVGCFAVVSSLRVACGRPGLVPCLRAVKEAFRWRSDGGAGYDLLRFLGGPEPGQPLGPPPPTGLRYLAIEPDPASLLRPRWEDLRPPTLQPGRLLEITVIRLGGRLEAVFDFRSDRLENAWVERLLLAFVAALAGCEAAASELAPPSWSPSDFPHARLDQAGLDRVLARLGSRAGETRE